MQLSAQPQLGRGYATAVGEAFAEQVVDALDLPTTAVVVDLITDFGTMGSSISNRLRPPGHVIACDLSPAELPPGNATLKAQPGQGVEVLSIEAGRVPLGDASCDAVVSLLTVGFGDAPSLLSEARRIARGPGRVAIVVYDQQAPPRHEAVLRDVLAAHGLESTFLDRLMPPGLLDVALHGGYSATSIRDVARFDGPGAFWEVMVERRPLGRELAAYGLATVAVVRAGVRAALRPYMAADDSIRIPMSALLLRA